MRLKREKSLSSYSYTEDVCGGLKIVILNHAKKNEPKYQIYYTAKNGWKSLFFSKREDFLKNLAKLI